MVIHRQKSILGSLVAGSLFLGSTLQASLWDWLPFGSSNKAHAIQVTYEEWANSENGFILYDCEGAHLNFESDLGAGLGLILAYAYDDQFTFDHLLDGLSHREELELDGRVAWALALASERVQKNAWVKSLDYEMLFESIVYKMRMAERREDLFLPAYNILDRGSKIGIIDPLSERVPAHTPATSFLLILRNNSLKPLEIDQLKGEGALTFNGTLSPIFGRPYSYSLNPLTTAKIIYTPSYRKEPLLTFALHDLEGKFSIALKRDSWSVEGEARSSDTALILNENIAFLSYTDPALREVDFSFMEAKEERVGRALSDYQNGKDPDSEFLIWASYEAFFKQKGDLTTARSKKIIMRYLDTVDLHSLKREPRELVPYYLAAILAQRPLKDECEELFSYTIGEQPPLTSEESQNAAWLLLIKAILENRLPSK